MYKKIKVFKISLPSFYAGPKEAYLQARIFQNIGFKNSLLEEIMLDITIFLISMILKKYLKN